MTAILALLADESPAGGLATVPTEMCAAALGADGVGVSVTDGGGAVAALVWHSPGVSARLDELQFTLGQGPGVDAARGEPVLEADLAAAGSRWPMYASGALELGVRAVLAVPLQIGAIRLGALVAHRAAPGRWSAGVLADAVAFCDALVAALLYRAGPGGPAVVFDRPSSYRAEVHQATGMLTVQLRVSAADALARLRAYAYSHERSVAEVARDVVARRLRFDEGENDHGR